METWVWGLARRTWHEGGVKDFQLKKQEIKSMQARLNSGLKGLMDEKKGEWRAVIKE